MKDIVINGEKEQGPQRLFIQANSESGSEVLLRPVAPGSQ